MVSREGQSINKLIDVGLSTATQGSSLRERVLDAAVECLLDFGHRRTTLSDIATRSGLSRASVYNHVGDRSAVFAALLRRELVRFHDSLTAVFDSELAGDELITEAVVQTIAAARGDALLQRLLTLEPDLVLPWLTTKSKFLLRNGTRTLLPHLEAAAERGEIRAVEPRAAAEWIVRVTLALVAVPEESSLFRGEDLRRLVREFLVVGLASHGPT